MARRVWIVRLPDGEHEVVLQHGFWSGKRLITIDGVEVHQSRVSPDRGSSTPIAIDSHTGYVVIVIGFPRPFFRYDLIFDGVSQATGQLALPPERTAPTSAETWVAIFEQTGAVQLPLTEYALFRKGHVPYWGILIAQVLTTYLWVKVVTAVSRLPTEKRLAILVAAFVMGWLAIFAVAVLLR